MNQKITLRFADHVLTFTLTEAEVAEVKLSMRRKWLYEFTRGDGDFIVNFDQVLWVKISPGDNAEIELGTVSAEFHFPVFDTPVSTLVFSDGDEHGNL